MSRRRAYGGWNYGDSEEYYKDTARVNAEIDRLLSGLSSPNLMSSQAIKEAMAEEERKRKAEAMQSLLGGNGAPSGEETLIQGYQMPEDMRSYSQSGAYVPEAEAGLGGMTIPKGQMLYTNNPNVGSQLGQEPAFEQSYSNLTSRSGEETPQADFSSLQGMRQTIINAMRSGVISPEKGITELRQIAEEEGRQTDRTTAKEDKKTLAQEKAEEKRLKDYDAIVKDYSDRVARINRDYTDYIGKVDVNQNLLDEQKQKLKDEAVRNQWRQTKQLLKNYSTRFQKYGNPWTEEEKAKYDEIMKFEEAPAKQSSGQVPLPGEVRGGYKFKGGDPSDKNNWEKV